MKQRKHRSHQKRMGRAHKEDALKDEHDKMKSETSKLKTKTMKDMV